MRKVLCASLLLIGCGAEDESRGPDSPGHNEPGIAQQAVVWNPSAPLVQQHVDWHLGACSPNGQPLSGQAGVGRRCTKTGEDFLIWHRAFIDRLRDDFEAQGLTHDITPWYSVPQEILTGAWSSWAQASIDAMYTMVNPSTGARFASLDEFGRHVEGTFHGALHAVAAQIWGTTDGPIGGVMSPQSTIFFKIHGLVEFHHRRFQQGDFNWDGKSDLFVRNRQTNTSQIWFMNDTTVVSKNNTTAVPPDSTCNWYVGATADMNFDGWNDLVWHGPGCSRVYVWTMNGTTRTQEFWIGAPMDSAWRLIGSGDFNNDMRPDLAFRNNASRDVQVWRMNGMHYRGAVTLDVPANWNPTLLSDLNDDGYPDLIYRRFVTGLPEYAVQYTGPGGALGALVTPSGVSTADLSFPNAAGRFHPGGPAADLLIEQHSASATGAWFNLLGSSTGSPSYSTGSTLTILPDEVVQGPR